MWVRSSLKQLKSLLYLKKKESNDFDLQDLLESNRKNMSYSFQPILPPSTTFNEATGNFVQSGKLANFEFFLYGFYFVTKMAEMVKI